MQPGIFERVQIFLLLFIAWGQAALAAPPTVTGGGGALDGQSATVGNDLLGLTYGTWLQIAIGLAVFGVGVLAIIAARSGWFGQFAWAAAVAATIGVIATYLMTTSQA